jgi:hypothetical protein
VSAESLSVKKGAIWKVVLVLLVRYLRSERQVEGWEARQRRLLLDTVYARDDGTLHLGLLVRVLQLWLGHGTWRQHAAASIHAAAPLMKACS